MKAIKCPSCKGSGKFRLYPDWRCLWCDGKKKLRKIDALRYADQLVTLGVGGYICGDHDLEDQKKMLRESDAICRAFGAEIIAPNYAR